MKWTSKVYMNCSATLNNLGDALALSVIGDALVVTMLGNSTSIQHSHPTSLTPNFLKFYVVFDFHA